MMEALTHFITGFGFAAVLLVVFAESGLLIGFFLPGDSLLFFSGFLVQTGVFHINVWLFIFFLWIAAVLGDNVGYSFGHKVGRKLFMKDDNKIFKKKYLLQAEAFFEKHGPISIFLARFVPIIRTFTPIIAGTSKMHYHTFFVWNILGGLAWTATFTLLGYYVGKILIDAGINIEIITVAIIFISILPIIIESLRTKENRASIMKASKKAFSKKKKSNKESEELSKTEKN